MLESMELLVHELQGLINGDPLFAELGQSQVPIPPHGSANSQALPERQLKTHQVPLAQARWDQSTAQCPLGRSSLGAF